MILRPKVSRRHSGRSSALDRIFADGDSLIDDAGKAIAVFAGFEPLTAQTLRFARPLDGIANAIKAALENPLDLPIPIPAKYQVGG
jgi:uncharacterized protein (DUF2062 family)